MNYHPRSRSAGMCKETSYRFKSEPKAWEAADQWVQSLETPRRRSVSPARETRPTAATSKGNAVNKKTKHAAILRGLRVHAAKMMRLRCSRLRHTALRRGVAEWRKKSPRVRKTEQPRRYLERQAASLEERADIRDRKAAASFTAIPRGNSISLLETHDTPPPVASEDPSTEVNVSDSPEIAAAKQYSRAVDCANGAVVKADFKRAITLANKARFAAVELSVAV